MRTLVRDAIETSRGVPVDFLKDIGHGRVSIPFTLWYSAHPKAELVRGTMSRNTLWRTAAILMLGGKCLNCGSTEALTIDHVVPRIKGGKTTLSNVQPLCQPCNHAKGIETIDYRSSLK